ncbi:hypothetical protein KC340_g141 [Hortaea werneckii]|nr:hypothetical protein KC340_g141 [Hortaea werneckii]
MAYSPRAASTPDNSHAGAAGLIGPESASCRPSIADADPPLYLPSWERFRSRSVAQGAANHSAAQASITSIATAHLANRRRRRLERTSAQDQWTLLAPMSAHEHDYRSGECRVSVYTARKRAEMRILHQAILFSCLAVSSKAWIATVTEWVTLDPSTASSAVQTPSDVRIKAFSESTAFATTTTAPSPSSIADKTPSSTRASISSEPTAGLLQATSQSAQPLPIATTASAPEYGNYNGGNAGSGFDIDSDAGASGSSSSFSLSRGGMIAVIVVVAVVAIFGSEKMGIP